MPPHVRLRPQQLCIRQKPQVQQCRYASLATATTPAPAIDLSIQISTPIQRFPPTQPPSYRQPQFRKSQLHRQYASLLRSTPLILIFQHNNLKSIEWMAIRRELAEALKKVDAAEGTEYADFIKMNIIQTGIFAAALKVVEFFQTARNPKKEAKPHPGDAAAVANTDPNASDYSHGLSKAAYDAANANKRLKHGLESLMAGPLMLLTMPAMSPAHLKAVLTILSPSKAFPAPKRRTNPTFHEPAVQNGLQKLLLLGARAEGRIFDLEGAQWIGGLEGGITGLRQQLVAILEGFGVNLTDTLEAASKSLYFAVEIRRSVLEEEEKPKDDKADESSSS
ncbi:hypothetical protein EJ08DRAFT_649586 [Tothia fuscella]|uniref:Uncharacterized protein n=1 Tax=Tothia fuscella TaxID=1048955 RepID=A0A9P4TZ55_9PEZI|nr:hypothetical protein EJ08DRAFT_649586 [Tothia fuscella]